MNQKYQYWYTRGIGKSQPMTQDVERMLVLDHVFVCAIYAALPPLWLFVVAAVLCRERGRCEWRERVSEATANNSDRLIA